MEVTLREWDHDASLPEGIVDREGHLTAHANEAVQAGPTAERELQLTVSEALEQGLRRRLGQDLRMVLGHLQQSARHQVRVGAVGNSHGNIHAAQLVGSRPVHDFSRNQLGVRHHNIGTLEGLQDTGAESDRSHPAPKRPQLHNVAGLDGTFKDQDQPGNEIVYDVLQSEAHAYTKRRGQYGQPIEIAERLAVKLRSARYIFPVNSLFPSDLQRQRRRFSQLPGLESAVNDPENAEESLKHSLLPAEKGSL
jgi:hypothetical protein